MCIITETIPGLASETVGVWVDAGSRDETQATAGSTHFLEHMLFKGTATRSAKAIARTFDRIGGDSNAVTAKEYTCYYARCLVADLPEVTDVLWDMVLGSVLDPSEFERERGVIVDELAMAADDPQDVLFEAFDALIYAGHPLGRPIGATRDRILALEHGELLDHYRSAYVLPRLTFSAAGGASHEEVVDRVCQALRAAGCDPEAPSVTASGAPPLLDVSRPVRTPAPFTPGVQHLTRETEQQSLILGTPGIAAGSPDRFTFGVLQSLLGGGMSSRLFQTVREEHGLAYAVHCTSSQHSDTGDFGIFAACAPGSAQQVASLCVAEFERLAEHLPGDEEVADVAAQIAASTVLGMESTAVRMNRLAHSQLFGITLSEPHALVERVRAVTPGDVRDLAARLFAGPWAMASIGPASFTAPF